MKYAQPGSVSTGTNRPQDLVPSFLDVLNECDPVIDEHIRCDIAATFGIPLCEMDDTDPAWETEDMAHILGYDICMAMDNIAPEGYYFGSHPGDGCDYGFWEIEDEEEVADCPGEILRHWFVIGDDLVIQEWDGHRLRITDFQAEWLGGYDEMFRIKPDLSIDDAVAKFAERNGWELKEC